LDFREKFSAKIFIKNKPDRYGTKIITLNNAKTYYLYNAIPYVGKVTHLEKMKTCPIITCVKYMNRVRLAK